jgi:threonine/homoserine/homoserine lactone efflux protein
MSIIEFTEEVVLLSASGVLSPGPLFLANLIYGSKHGLHSGIEISLGHTIVELPLIILLALGIFEYSSFTLTDESLRIIGLIGGIAIIIFSMAQLSNMIKKREDIVDIHDKRSRNKDEATSLLNRMTTRIEGRPIIVVGILFTAMNPFFIFWWLTVGFKLISDSIYLIYLGLVKVLLFYFYRILGWIMHGWQLQHI